MVPSTIELYILYIYSYMYIYSRYIYYIYRATVQGTRYKVQYGTRREGGHHTRFRGQAHSVIE